MVAAWARACLTIVPNRSSEVTTSSTPMRPLRRSRHVTWYCPQLITRHARTYEQSLPGSRRCTALFVRNLCVGLKRVGVQMAALVPPSYLLSTVFQHDNGYSSQSTRYTRHLEPRLANMAVGTLINLWQTVVDSRKRLPHGHQQVLQGEAARPTTVSTRERLPLTN